MGTPSRPLTFRVAASLVGAGVLLGYLGPSALVTRMEPPARRGIIRPPYPILLHSSEVVAPFGPAIGRPGNPITGLVVNHHLLATSFINDVLARARRPFLRRIILIAPDHFAAGARPLTTTAGDFATPFGAVRTDRSAVRYLERQGVASSTAPFTAEHGITNLLPFIARAYPGVPIVPIIVRPNASDTVVDSQRDVVRQLISSNTLVIASLDFAHGETDEGAQQLDAGTLEVLRHLRVEQANRDVGDRIAVDAPAALRLFLGLMRDRGAHTFTLLNHSNSAQESGRLDATDVTSHITGLFSRFPLVIQ